ncbi:MAG: hypothetical protein KA250_00165 [Verrucomicrobiales bacterium]|jgi:hypothetical protein|nr:hypothetical protein [Verrucomicrobiales bacterium]
MVDYRHMDFLRGLSRFAAIIGTLTFVHSSAFSQGAGTVASPDFARLAILLDTSAEMGFLVPQVRKEVRILNEQLLAIHRPPVILREFEGASVERAGSLSLGARKNLIHPLTELFAEADTVYWFTPLKGQQSSVGLFDVEALLRMEIEDRPTRKLFIRNIWQEQLQAGDTWGTHPERSNDDPLDLRNRPQEWYRLIGEKRGLVIRSWQSPPADLRESFGFPYRVVGAGFLKKLDLQSNEAFFDLRWAREFEGRHGLRVMRAKEEWPLRLVGHRWLFESSLVPFLDEKALQARSTVVYEALCARETIEEDLQRINASRLGILFGFGYVAHDLEMYRVSKERAIPPRSWREFYIAELARIVGESLEHIEARRAEPESPQEDLLPQRFYSNERVELEKNRKLPEGPNRYAYRIAQLIRDQKVDAVYLFTNGYVGGGDYGTIQWDMNLLSLALRDTGVKLYVRIPFEFGPVPVELSQLALASGGTVFRGKINDKDWEIPQLEPAWPELETERP